jgi:hypothetical protein
MEEYLTVRELSNRIKFSKQTLYNFICDKTFELNKHYVKPTRKKILFKWSEIKKWLEQPAEINDKTVSDDIDHKYLSESTIQHNTICNQKASLNNPTDQSANITPKSLINI